MRMMMPTILGSAVIAMSVATVLAQVPTGHTPATPGAQPATQAPPTGRRPATAGAKIGMNADEQFVKDAAMGGMAEVELGHLASDKATNAGVKTFAQQMVTDHGKADDELKSLASSKTIAWPTALDMKHKETKDRLAKLDGPAFDRAYIAEMLSGHQAASTLFRRESENGIDSELRAFAAKTLPVVEGHLQMVQDISKEMATTPTGTSGRTSSGTTDHDQPSGATRVPDPR